MNIYRILARALASFFLLLVLIILIGESVNDNLPIGYSLNSTEIALFISMGLTLVGMLLAWRFERLGGWLTIAGAAAFALIDSLASGAPRINGVFAGMAVSGLLFLLSDRVIKMGSPA